MVNYRERHHAGAERVFAALSDPKRAAIVDRLSRGEATSSELAQPLGLSLPAFAKHLKVLQDSGVVTSSKSGRVRSCRLNIGRLRQAEDWIAARARTWERNLDTLQKHLSTKASTRREKR